MSEQDHIRGFLERVRRRFLVRDAIKAAGIGGSMLAGLLFLLAMVASALGPAGFWRPLTILSMLCCLSAVGVAGVWRPFRVLRADRTARRTVRRLGAPLTGWGGDLISAVELAAPPASATSATPESAVSRDLVTAFQGRVVERLRDIDPESLIPLGPAKRTLALLAATVLLFLAGARLAPDAVGRGLTTLFHRPTRFEGAAVSLKALVGDVRITYEYPAYTGLARRTVEGSTGDIVAVKGTRVKIETTPLRKSRQAMLLLGEAGDLGEVQARLSKGVITAHLTLNESGVYRFWLQPLIGRAVREDRSHRLEAETDRPPRVEIRGPADRLELATPRPIEIGFAADDDYGLGLVELVFRIDDEPEQRQLLKDGSGARVAQGRTLWDPGRLGLSAGARIAYHVEARDRDDVSGAKSGVSRTLYVTIARPEETVDTRLDRQREVLEGLTTDLADRLEAPSASGGPAGGAGASDASLSRLQAAALAVHEAEEAHVALLGRLVDEDRRQQSLSKSLRASLSSIADRLGKLLRAEKEVMGRVLSNGPGGSAGNMLGIFPGHSAREVRAHGASGMATRSRPFSAPRWESQNAAHIIELERDVLQLDDLIGRQRLEDLAALGHELTDAHHRLQDLLSRYAATKDEALKRQIEREVRELRARIADLAQRIASLKTRNEVPDEWRNMPDATQLAEQAKKLDDLLAEGDPSAMSRALDELGRDLRSLRQMLDENAEGFGADRFPQENRVVSQLMKKIGDLEGDERTLAAETQSLSDKQEQETEKRLRGQLGEWSRKEAEKVERLRNKLAQMKIGDPESALSEEVERARESTRQMKRLLAERDLAETKDEAERAAGSMDRALEHIEEARAPRKLQSEPAKSVAANDFSEARALAQEIADDVKQLLPKPEETLSPEERARAAAQAERQGAIGERTEDAAREAARLGKMPGLEKAEDDLRAAAEQMRQAASHLRSSQTKQASGAERNAAERLAKLRDAMQERSMGGAKNQRDPVRIPGADESSAPRAWRQELLDAMKEKAPERFRDDVRRYYEELVR